MFDVQCLMLTPKSFALNQNFLAICDLHNIDLQLTLNRVQ